MGQHESSNLDGRRCRGAARAGAAAVIAKQIPVIVPDPSDPGHTVPPDPAFLNPQRVQRDVEFLRNNRPELFQRLSNAVRRDLICKRRELLDSAARSSVNFLSLKPDR